MSRGFSSPLRHFALAGDPFLASFSFQSGLLFSTCRSKVTWDENSKDRVRINPCIDLGALGGNRVHGRITSAKIARTAASQLHPWRVQPGISIDTSRGCLCRGSNPTQWPRNNYPHAVRSMLGQLPLVHTNRERIGQTSRRWDPRWLPAVTLGINVPNGFLDSATPHSQQNFPWISIC